MALSRRAALFAGIATLAVTLPNVVAGLRAGFMLAPHTGPHPIGKAASGQSEQPRSSGSPRSSGPAGSAGSA